MMNLQIDTLAVENTQKGNLKALLDKEDLVLQTIENPSDQWTEQPMLVSRNIIHFYFCVDGPAEFAFGPHYSRQIERQRNYFFYNPDADLPFTLKLAPGGRLVILSIMLESLHKLFTRKCKDQVLR
jgi:hypothetical protein